MRLRAALSQMRGDRRAEVVHLAAHGLVRDGDPALSEQIFDVTKAEREPVRQSRSGRHTPMKPLAAEARR
jgi:hypothetical protein